MRKFLKGIKSYTIRDRPKERRFGMDLVEGHKGKKDPFIPVFINIFIPCCK